MYLHLGNEVSVITRDVVGIFDLDCTTTSRDTRNFLSRCEDGDIVTNVSSDLPKSFILYCKSGRPHVYISAISTNTLRKRALYLSR